MLALSSYVRVSPACDNIKLTSAILVYFDSFSSIFTSLVMFSHFFSFTFVFTVQLLHRDSQVVFSQLNTAADFVTSFFTVLLPWILIQVCIFALIFPHLIILVIVFSYQSASTDSSVNKNIVLQKGCNQLVLD